MTKFLSLSLIANILLIGVILYMIHALGGFNYLRFKMKNRGIAGAYQHRLNLFEQMPVKEGDIVFLGNSITAYCEWAELFDNDRIKNRGIAGDMTDGVLKRLGEITQARPAKIFLMIGVNDLIIRSPKEILAYYEQIINKVNFDSPTTKMFVYKVLPVNNEVKHTGLSNSDIALINQGILEKTQKSQVELIDLHPLLTDEKGQLSAQFTKDGIHINGDAYLLWKKAIEHLVNDDG